jgi:hypothetical protein
MKGDPTMAVNAAKSFFALAGTFFKALPEDPHQRDSYLSSHSGMLIAATTNLAFAVELYLKAISLLTTGAAKWGHDLLAKYEELLPQVRTSIEECYQFRIENDQAKKFPAVILGFAKQNKDPSQAEKDSIAPITPNGDDVVSLLKAHKNAFDKWRYLHEAADTHQSGSMTVHWYKIGVFINAMQDQFIPPAHRPSWRK